MWISSQNKKALVKTEDICVSGSSVISCDRDCTLGEYATEKRAKEVLHQIRRQIETNLSVDTVLKGVRTVAETVFQMPLE